MSTAVPMIADVPDQEAASVRRRPLGRLDVTAKGKRIKLPLAAVKIDAVVADRLAHVTINQTFHNPFSDHLEAVYVFPLSGGCAVSSFQLKVGDRIIESKVLERQMARDEYNQAIQQGRRAALMEQERENVFTVQVGNLPPGEEINVFISYSEKLSYFDQGTTEIRLPLVVAPRYIPGTPLERDSVGDGVELDTSAAPDASRITPPLLASGADAMIDLSINVTIESHGLVEDLACSQHANRFGTTSSGIKISLLRDDEVMNRDFVLRWRMANDNVQSRFLIYDQPAGGDEKVDSQRYGMISLVPPRADDIARPARDVIFVLDRSGSMQGEKMISAARACSFLISTLGPNDRFAIQIFDDHFEWLKGQGGGHFFAADEDGLEAANDYLRAVEARGGTEVGPALLDAISVMSKRSSEGTRMPVILLLTDGQVGNEAEVYKEIQRVVGDIRLFSVGIDTAVNDAFLRRLASLGGGTCAFVTPGAQLEQALSQVGREIGSPLISQLALKDDNCGLDLGSLAPNNLPVLFEGRAVTVFFRLNSNDCSDLSRAKLRLTGKYESGGDFTQELTAEQCAVKALPQLWAKAYITDLEDSYRVAAHAKQSELKEQIIKVSVAHAVLSKFTAFVAVDLAEIVNPDGSRKKVIQPVATPAEWASEEEVARNQMAVVGRLRTASAASAFNSANAGSIGSYGAIPAPVDSFASMAAPPPPPSVAFSASSAPPAPQAPLSKDAAPPSAASSPPPPPGAAGGAWGGAKSSWGAPPKQIFDNLQKQIGNLFQGPAASPVPVPMPVPMPVPTPMQAAPLNPVFQATLQAAFDRFRVVLLAVLDSVERNMLPETARLTDLEETRLKLLSLLNQSMLENSADLQKYLKAEMLSLLAALKSVKTVTPKLTTLCVTQRKIFERAAEEFLASGKNQNEQPVEPFWEAGV